MRESLQGPSEGLRQGPVAKEEAVRCLPCRIVVKNKPPHRGGKIMTLREVAAIHVHVGEEEICTICQESLEPGDEVKKLPCYHEFILNLES